MIPALMTYCGINIYFNPLMVDKILIPCRSKKKRIKKKWAKNQKNYKTKPSENIYKTPFGLFIHSAIAPKLKQLLKDNNNAAYHTGRG